MSRTYNFKTSNGNVFNFSIGTIYFSEIENLLYYGDISFLNIQRGSIAYSDEYNVVNVSMSRKDSMSAIDFTFGFKYGFYENFAFRLGITIPSYTAYDKDLENNQGRQIVADFGIDYVF